jgi:uncharacterized protein (DUF983 family)
MPAALARAKAAFLQRCPRCLRGRVFKGSVAMNESCPSCGLSFHREAGYYLGAMYFSYAIACVFIAAATLALVFCFPQHDDRLLVLCAAVLFLPFVPLTFRWSRVLWMHFDQLFDPE